MLGYGCPESPQDSTIRDNGPMNAMDTTLLSVARRIWHAPLMSTVSRCFPYYVLYMLLLKPLLVTLFAIQRPWGPMLTATLQNGDTVSLVCRRNGRETDDMLIHDSKNGRVNYTINNTHALNALYAKICIGPDNTTVWVESGSRVVATLETASGTFHKEGVQQPAIAVAGTGDVLTEGVTTHWWELFLPL